MLPFTAADKAFQTWCCLHQATAGPGWPNSDTWTGGCSTRGYSTNPLGRNEHPERATHHSSCNIGLHSCCLVFSPTGAATSPTTQPCTNSAMPKETICPSAPEPTDCSQGLAQRRHRGQGSAGADEEVGRPRGRSGRRPLPALLRPLPGPSHRSGCQGHDGDLRP